MKLIRKIKLRWYYWKKYQRWEHPLYREWLYIKDRLKAWWKARAFNKAKKMAVARHKADGRTYYVLPDDRGVPRAFNNKEIAILKAHRLINKNVTCLDLYREAMYIVNAKTIKEL